MKKIIKLIFGIFLTGLILSGIAYLLNSRYHIFKGHTLGTGEHSVHKEIYYCPMHPGFTSDKPGDCSICGMKLVKKEEAQAIEGGVKSAREICILHNCKMANCQMEITGDIKDCPFCGAHLDGTKEKKILYYRNPMNPEVTSPVPMKDPMGMDYIPVYAEGISPEQGLSISLERQQMIGVKKERVEKRKLSRQILTVGKVAYDPGLYVAQQEYLQALKARERLGQGALIIIKEQSDSLVEASKRKLILLGMNEPGIEELAVRGEPQGGLYLPSQQDKAWIYITIYEYEIGLIKEAQEIDIEAVAFPGEVFKAKIAAITPVLDPMTRSIQVRAELDNPEHKLKPDMFVNVKINVDFGEKLAVSEEAVINTGKRMLVVTANERGSFFSREVRLGRKAEGFYEVLEGLKEGDTVITSGNFLIDSESRLQSAISGEHKHGE